MKIRPSLTDGTRRLMKDATAEIKEYLNLRNPPDFVLPDIHGNLLVKMKFKSRLGLFVKFRNLESFRTNVLLAQETKPDAEFNHYDVEESADDELHGMELFSWMSYHYISRVYVF